MSNLNLGISVSCEIVKGMLERKGFLARSRGTLAVAAGLSKLSLLVYLQPCANSEELQLPIHPLRPAESRMVIEGSVDCWSLPHSR